MTFVDTIIVLIALGAIVIGWRKGLIKQAASLISWAIGIVACLFMGDAVTQAFLAINPDAANWPLSSITVKAVALSLLFLIVTLVVRVIAYITRKVVKGARLGCLDRIGGAALFAFKYLFILSILLNLFYAYNPDAETFGTKHMLNNKPYEVTLDLMPFVLGADVMPSDSLKLYRDSVTVNQDNALEAINNKNGK